jgi:hypothetical protein
MGAIPSLMAEEQQIQDYSELEKWQETALQLCSS